MTVTTPHAGPRAAAAPLRAGCSALSEEAGEPLGGTAPAARRLIAVEHVGAWPRTVADHADPDVAELFGRLRREDVLLLLIRESRRDGTCGDAKANLRQGRGWRIGSGVAGRRRRRILIEATR